MAIVEKTKREDTGTERFEIHLGGVIYVLSLEAGEKIARDILSLVGIEVAQLEADLEEIRNKYGELANENSALDSLCNNFIREKKALEAGGE